MEKRKRDIAILAVLLVVLLAGILKSIFFSKKPAKQETPVSQVVSDSMTNSSFLESIQQNEHTLETQESKWNKDWGRDPFLAGRAIAVKGLTGFVLSGIIWDEKQPLVIINSRVLKAGDMIEDFLVVEIKQDSVILSKGGQNFEVQLFE